MARKPRDQFTDFLPKHPRQITRVAHHIRATIGFNEQRAPNILQLLDVLKIAYPRLKIRFVPDSLLPNAEAQAVPKSLLIKVRKSVKHALESGSERARWTIAHELGHIFLRHPKTAYRLVQASDVRSADREMEREAHKFAAEFLAPDYLANNCDTAEELGSTFRIGSEAAQRRLSDLEAMPLFDRREITFSLKNTISGLVEQSNRSSKTFVTPLTANIAMTVKAIMTAAQLLSTAYETVRKAGCHQSHQMAATIFVAILVIRPIRTKHSRTATPAEIDALNEECAVRVVTDFLKLETEQTIHELRRTLYEAAVACRDYSYLKEFTREIISYIRHSTFPSYGDYKTDISWDEVHEIDKLMNLICVAETADARFLTRMN